MDISSLTPRRFALIDAKRALLIFALIGSSTATFWFLLPFLQWLCVPIAQSGEWVIRPVHAVHIVAAAFLGCLVTVPILRRIKSHWDAQDQSLGTYYAKWHLQGVERGMQKIGIAFLWLVYALALWFYLFSFERIGPTGLEVHRPWSKRVYTFDQVQRLRTIPSGFRSSEMKKNGPWFELSLSDGTNISFSSDSEGLADDQLASLANFIGQQTKREWDRIDDEAP